MGTISFAAPLLPGKTEQWSAWARSMNGEKASEFKDLNRRYGLTRHVAALQQTPMGDLVIVTVEGPGAEEFMPKIAVSENMFDISFREHVSEFHGVDWSNPPPPPTPVLGSGS